MTGITADGIEIDREFEASADAVFAAWTTPQHFARWFGGEGVDVPLNTLDFAAEPGRPWAAQMRLPDGATIDWAGDVVEVAPPQRFVFTITDRPDEPARGTIVVELTPAGTGTRMRFTQETPGFSSEQQEAVLAGWQSFIDVLEQIATA
ncbi:SRPBCC domain-containing protein [Gryllotalpicola reticulitermitis]|uniref:SRPBCC domain-containing protein n=1 Tax=Gryllotalpicola reticulitermitis TaxID=1184153 RepID=A0ABV8Q7G6_9MICO